MSQREMTGACANAVLPNMKTIESGEYAPLSRPLYMYVNKKSVQKPAVAAFLDFLLNDGQEIIDEAQYIRLDQTSLAESRKRLEEASVGVKIDGELKGTPTLDGSSTVYPIAAGAAEAFGDRQPDAIPVVGKSGTGGGFKKFVIGETDINNASRPISYTEIEQCRKNQVEYLELKVAIDGLAVVVNPANTFCDCLSVEQLKQVWEPESKITKWSDLNPEWPAQEIKLYVRILTPARSTISPKSFAEKPNPAEPIIPQRQKITCWSKRGGGRQIFPGATSDSPTTPETPGRSKPSGSFPLGNRSRLMLK